MQEPRFKSLNYAIGMFGTSIPINMLKTYAALQLSSILFW